MQKTIQLLILILAVTNLQAQGYAVTLDSLTHAYIHKLPRSKQVWFDSLLAQRNTYHLLNRLDSLPFDHAFIEEEYCYANTLGSVTERYFLGADTIPRYLYENGQFTDPEGSYNGFYIEYSKRIRSTYSLYPLIRTYAAFKPVQVFPYDKEQIWEHGCVIFENSEARFKKHRKKELKSTYRIMTWIDKTQNKVLVSVQYAPKNPNFKTVGYNSVWDW